MKVRAIKMGYINNQRKREGEVFHLKPIERILQDGKKIIISAEKQFSKIWMEKIEEDKPKVDVVADAEKESDKKAPTGDQSVI